jgi:hypothetical protein
MRGLPSPKAVKHILTQLQTSSKTIQNLHCEQNLGMFFSQGHKSMEQAQQ